MAIEVACRCGQRYSTAEQFAGQTLQCPNCGQPIVVPVLLTEAQVRNMEFCDFCHQWIPRREMSAHVAEHLKLQEDGQHTDYATLTPEERASEKQLADEPQWYRHTKCDAVTGMPDEIILTYLANPWFYLSDRTYCSGCEKHVHLRECVWEETGENLQTYTDRLRAAKPELRPSIYIRCLAWFYSTFRGG
jgi:hypothetical protein